MEIGLFLGFLLGLTLGIFLVKNSYGLAFLTLLLKTPLILVKSPGKIRERLKVWREFRIKARVQTKIRQQEIERLNQKIQELQKEIGKTKVEIRKVKWLVKEPLD